MNDWFNVLKVQILDTTTDLNIDMEPMVSEDKRDDCCEEAKDKYNKVARLINTGRYKITTMVEADEYDCDEFKARLKRGVDIGWISKQWLKKILREWEVCDWERHGHERPANFGGWMWDNE